MDKEQVVALEISKMSKEDRVNFIKATVINNPNSHDPIVETISPLDDLNEHSPLGQVESALRTVVSSLNGADHLRYATVREAAIKKLETIGVGAPARLIDAAFQNGQSGTSEQQQGRPVIFDDPEPWPEPVDGDEILAETENQIKRFVIVTDEQALAIALWVFHAHALDAADVSPPLNVQVTCSRMWQNHSRGSSRKTNPSINPHIQYFSVRHVSND